MDSAKEITTTAIGVALYVGGTVLSFKLILDLVSSKSKLLGGAVNKMQGWGNQMRDKAKEKAEGSNFYQRRKLADEARKQERRRANIEDYAGRVSGERGSRIGSALLRRRAAGGLTGQILNTNRPGQQRIAQSAEEQLVKQRHEEAGRAATRMARMGFEGDQDFEDIARAAEGQQLTSRTGQIMTVTGADRQAAINNLVQQGRVGRIRGLEGLQGRGQGGAPTTDLHHMLDEAYKDYGSKLGDKAPDLMPSRRVTQGLAAFTNVKPKDVTDWHESTVSEAERYYNSSGNIAAQADTLRAFGEASDNPTTLAQLDREQVTNFRNMMKRYQNAGHFIDQRTAGLIDLAYEKKGGNANDPVPPHP